MALVEFGIAIVVGLLLVRAVVSLILIQAEPGDGAAAWYRSDRADEAEDACAARLVAAHQAGKRPFALDGIRELYWDRVLASARLTIADADDPDYVTRRVFMRLSSDLDTLELRPDLPFRVWLFRLARATIRDARAGRLRGSRPPQPPPPRGPRMHSLSEDDYVGIVLGRALHLSLPQLATELGRPRAEVDETLRQLMAPVWTVTESPGDERDCEQLPMRMRARGAPVTSARRQALQTRRGTCHAARTSR